MTAEVTSRGGSEQRHPPQPSAKIDEIEIQIIDQASETQEIKRSTVGWVCCAPFIWLRTSTTVHKIALTTATLLVTSLLVASPILFLISTAPSQAPYECHPQEDDDCMPTPAPPPECIDPQCRVAATTIQARINWRSDPCKDFKTYSCSPVQTSLRSVKSAQEAADLLMQQLLSYNTTTGPFRKLGRLYGSCLRQTINSSTIRLIIDELGGYLPIGALGPSTIAPLVTKINDLGPTPIIETYYDLSYGRRPQIMLIIDAPAASPYVLESSIRWMGAKAPPFVRREKMPAMLDDLLDYFLPSSLSNDQRINEKNAIENFIAELVKIRTIQDHNDFSNSYIIYNITTLTTSYPFMNWTSLITTNWSGPIIVRSSDYLRRLRILLTTHQSRVIHNSLLLLFALSALPPGHPSPEICTRATIWAMPEVSSALFLAQYPEIDVENSIHRTEMIFESLKAYLKRTPSLRGAALVKLSQLKIQAKPWPDSYNITISTEILNDLEISSDNWFANVMKIYKLMRKTIPTLNMTVETHNAWAYPMVSRTFYDVLSHSIVVPLSVVVVPYFNNNLPPYLHYSTVGVSLAKEILRSITRTFEDKQMRCVPASVDIFSNSSRMDILIHSGAMQIAYHSMLALTGPMRGMERLPGLNLTPTQIFFLLSAQELCSESLYSGIDTTNDDFGVILAWLIAQGGSATEVFQCPIGSMINSQKTCNVL